MALIYPVLSLMPDFTKDPAYGLDMPHDPLAIAEGRIRVSFPSVQPDRVFGFEFTFDTLAEIRDLKRFFLGRGGRAHPFYLPSWRTDLPPVSGTVGSLSLNVEAEEFAAAHLDDTRPDHYGRQLFIWQPGETLWTERIVAAADAGGGITTLDLETPLPFTINPDLAIIGFCHLARFQEDRLDWKHWRPELARVAIRFRGIRQHNLNTQTNPVARLDYYGSLGFVSVTQSPVDTEPSTNRSAYAAGPVNLHYSQDAYYFTRWACWVQGKRVRLKRLATGEIVHPDTGGGVSGLFTGVDVVTDHISLCFDQNAWETIAWQKTPGTIQLRRFFNSATDIVEWPGIDPVLVYNQLMDPNLESGDADTVCYYLKPNSNFLFVRFQRENFGTENIAALLPLRPLALKRTWIEDQIQFVEILDAGFRSAILKTATYPDPPPPPPPPPEVPVELAPEAGRGSLTHSGAYDFAVVYADGAAFDAPHPPFQDTGTGRIVHAGNYEDVTFETEVGRDAAGGRVGEGAAAYSQVVLSGGGLDVAAGGLTFASIAHTLQALSPPQNTEAGTGSLSITANYEAI